MNIKFIVVCVFLCASVAAEAQIRIGVGLPGVGIGINFGGYPDFAPIEGYPVYYAPQADANLFFYDGAYWVYADDRWYSSGWYNGPWDIVDRDLVPMYVLRVPVRYYRRQPAYFRGWAPDAPPRWGAHWGKDWERRHRNWNLWQRAAAPARAPLPVYQRAYTGDRYPHATEQRNLHQRNYRYEPRERVVRRQYEQRASDRSTHGYEQSRAVGRPGQSRDAQNHGTPNKQQGQKTTPGKSPTSHPRSESNKSSTKGAARAEGRGRDNIHTR